MFRVLALTNAALFSMTLASVAVFAQGNDANKEASTALAHAQMAAATDSIKMVHMHLHHVVNCIVGTQGAGFDAAAGDPCKGMGEGAMHAAGAQAAEKARLEKAVAVANTGIQSDSYAVAHKAALKTAEILKATGPDHK